MRICQMTAPSASQMMGYVLVTNGGKVLVIDGGTKEDAPELRRILSLFGNRVDAWFLTHPHRDHHGAFVAISQKPGFLRVRQVYRSTLPDPFAENEPFHNDIDTINRCIESTPFPVTELSLGDHFEWDEVQCDILGVANLDITVNAVNNSSCVLRIADPKFSMIFLGDLGVEGGRRLLAQYGDLLTSDAVQMAHHGQNGVSREVYERIAPRYAFWPTPNWLWTNTPTGQAAGSGPWKTLEVRNWMKELGTIDITTMHHSIVFNTVTKTIATI